jgi:hypothetical protein
VSAPGAFAEGRAPLVLQGGSATSIRLRGEANAYNMITISDGGALSIVGRVWAGSSWGDAPAQIVDVVADPLAPADTAPSHTL